MQPDFNARHKLYDKTDVMDLAAAIARGDCAAAAESLDHLFCADSVVTEWIAQARVTRAARPETKETVNG